jgi:hypothetical protein
MTSAIVMIGGNIPASEYSHNASWAHLRANQLRNLGIEVDVLDSSMDNNWSKYETIFLYHGINFHKAPPGKEQGLNLFGGANEANAKFFEKLALSENEHLTYISLDYKMPDYGAICKRRKSEPETYWGKVDWDNVSRRCKDVELVRDPALFFTPGEVKHLTIGDSHSHSAYKPSSMVLRKDGRTLAGVLKKSIKKEITDGGFNLDNLDSLTCYWGNIDIRHHICRAPDPKAYLKELLKRYEIELQGLNKPIELVTPVPIEDESRKLPTTGFFEGTPFFGSRAQRMELVEQFKDELHEMVVRNSGWSLYAWPNAWYKMDGIEFMSTIMERNRSVHLAWKYYRWDLVNNVPNPNLIQQSRPLLDF